VSHTIKARKHENRGSLGVTVSLLHAIPCSSLEVYEHFERNFGTYLPNYTVSHRRRQ